MPSIRTEPDSVAWTPWTEVFGDGAFYEGRPIIEAKTLSDRRNEGGGIAYMLRFRPPEGKLIRLSRSRARTSTSSFSAAGGQPSRGSRSAPRAVIRSIPTSSRTAR
jgi:hypothetical protein